MPPRIVAVRSQSDTDQVAIRPFVRSSMRFGALKVAQIAFTMTTSRSQLAERRAVSSSPFDIEAAPLGRLRSLAQVHRYRRRQRQSLSGVSGMFIVRSGLLTVCAGGNDGKTTIVELLYPGDTYHATELVTLPDLAISASLAAECWRIAPHAFAQEIGRDGALANYIVDRQNAQRARLQLHIAILAGLSSEQRVAALLIEGAAQLGSANHDTVSFELPWSRVEVAEYLSLNADTLSRIMSRLTQSGVIKRMSRSQLAVLKWRELLAMCPLADAVLALHKPDLRTI